MFFRWGVDIEVRFTALLMGLTNPLNFVWFDELNPTSCEWREI